MTCDEAQELITALVDNELSLAERSAVESHLNGCPNCHRAYAGEQALKSELRLAAASITAPAELRERIRSDPRLFPEADGAQGPEAVPWIFRPLLRPAFVMAILVLLVLPALYLMQPVQPVSFTALETHERILDGTIPFVRSQKPEELEGQLARSVAGRFGPMGYDLSKMNLLPAGGIVQEFRGRKLLVTVYEGKAPSLSCYTFLGTERDAPQSAAVHFDPEKKLNFYTFSRDGINAVLHRERELICILVSKIPMAELLALARAKAQPS